MSTGAQSSGTHSGPGFIFRFPFPGLISEGAEEGGGAGRTTRPPRDVNQHERRRARRVSPAPSAQGSLQMRETHAGLRRQRKARGCFLAWCAGPNACSAWRLPRPWESLSGPAGIEVPPSSLIPSCCRDRLLLSVLIHLAGVSSWHSSRMTFPAQCIIRTLA